MHTIKRADSKNLDFQLLIQQLDKDLAIKNGTENDFFAQYNKTDLIKHVIIAYENDKALGCGAIKEYEEGIVEIKRMFVCENKRGNGIATIILNELQSWAAELGYKRCILETGAKMIEAVNLYKKNDFKVISNYGQYADIETSICFEKEIFPKNLQPKK
ncbi:Acetyltransferase (GNAT) family protein [Paenimyroides ummariense]|uniref:Acetyltransferase (GNAT) family protein n=1 Tax=Paenimyroides ummariense TaxID=913024 RepID=A0A1I5F352_9FLAO|nr:GNAT family N-acetyltransferase [Paenimyroides ummariense]SFO18046.1 Acetyltransferase (GNAT) family protein [Paenimyroides ummariense]